MNTKKGEKKKGVASNAIIILVRFRLQSQFFFFLFPMAAGKSAWS